MEYYEPESKPKPSSYNSFPLIAGILLVIAGVSSIIIWVPIIVADTTMIEQAVDITQFQQIDPSITIENIKELFNICATVGIIISIFTILGGILSIKRKQWGIALSLSIIGLYGIFPLIIGGILSFIALILIALSRKEFQRLDSN